MCCWELQPLQEVVGVCCCKLSACELLGACSYGMR